MDTDIPSSLEAKLFGSTAGKLVWVILQIFFYLLRPLFVNPRPPTFLEFINFAVQITFDVVVLYNYGKLYLGTQDKNATIFVLLMRLSFDYISVLN